MAKKSAKPQPEEIEPEEISQEIPDEEPETATQPEPAPSSTGKSVTKAQACRAALADGITDFEDAAAFTKSRFGVEILPTDFTLYKSKEKAKQGAAAPVAKGKPGRKPKAAAVDDYVAPPAKVKSPGEPDMLVALESIKGLVNQFGADKLKRLVDIIG